MGAYANAHGGAVTCLAPGLNDPTVISVLGSAYTVGMQRGLPGQSSKYVKIAAIGKHVGAYSVETQRQSFDAIVDPIDLHETYLPGWLAAGRAGLSGAMCSYNAINGVPACADSAILTSLFRGELGMKGYAGLTSLATLRRAAARALYTRIASGILDPAEDAEPSIEPK
eukprot:gene10640-2647_t